MKNTTIAFIGAGNMATALVKGLIANGADPASITAADRNAGKLEALKRECGIATSADNVAAASGAELVVLAVKPQGLRQAAQEIRPALAARPRLLVSVAAGITLDSLRSWTGPAQAIVRCMPNTPSLVGAGASALYANDAVSDEQKAAAEALMSAVGSVCWLAREAEMDAVTALSGSGPAYFFLLMEAMREAGEKLGLERGTAESLCLQTAFGAARLAQQSGVPVEELRRRVTSPGGTTEAALRQFAEDRFKDIVQRALTKAAERSRELARQTGEQL